MPHLTPRPQASGLEMGPGLSRKLKTEENWEMEPGPPLPYADGDFGPERGDRSDHVVHLSVCHSLLFAHLLGPPAGQQWSLSPLKNCQKQSRHGDIRL
jgi:hypothetical protein